jgi:hypothetical protein
LIDRFNQTKQPLKSTMPTNQQIAVARVRGTNVDAMMEELLVGQLQQQQQ